MSPDPAPGAYDAPPGWGIPLPISLPRRAFGVSISVPQDPHFFGQVYAPALRSLIRVWDYLLPFMVTYWYC